DRLAGVEQRGDAIDGLDQDVIDTDGAAGLGSRLGDLENHPLGFGEDFLAGPPLRRIGAVGDLVADADQLAQGGALVNDLSVGLDVGHRGRVLRQFAEIGATAHLRQMPFLVQLLGQGHHVERRIALGQGEDGTEDQPVVMAIEVAIGNLIEHPCPGAGIQHQAAEHGLLGLDGMRRHLERGGFQIVLLGDADVVHGHSLLLRYPLVSRQAETIECPVFRKTKGTLHSHGKRARCYSSGASSTRRETAFQPATTISLTVASTSVCRCTATSYSPTWRMVPFGRRTSLLATSTPEAVRASAMSAVPMEPNSLPSSPAVAVMVTSSSASCAARVSAEAFLSAAAFSRSARRASKAATLAGVAAVALPCGRRKLRP